MEHQSANAEPAVVNDFGNQWSRFDQSEVSDAERQATFDEYFGIFPWDRLPKDAVGFDLGCGSGRWAMEVAPRVGHLHCIDPSRAIEVARRNLQHATNCSFHQHTADTIPLPDGSMDFGYSLGVLHHIPNTQAALAACVRKLKPGAPFLLYLYYAFDNMPFWFRCVGRTVDGIRAVVSALPDRPKYWTTQTIAALIYWPLARIADVLDRSGFDVVRFPLGNYRDKSFYSMRTDALDRFGTRLSKRFTKAQLQDMMEAAGLQHIQFSSGVPFWCAVGDKK